MHLKIVKTKKEYLQSLERFDEIFQAKPGTPGFKSRVSDIFKKNRKLNLGMIRKLYRKLHIPLETLVKEY